MNKKFKLSFLIIALIDVGILFYVEQYLKPGYWIKSAIKVTLFLGTIVVYSLLSGQKIKDTINLKKIKNAKKLYLLMAGAYAAIIIIFLLVRNSLNLSEIKTSLLTKENMTENNFIYVFIYIIICNSFLEESFFRGFVANLIDGKWGKIVSAVLFALYHIGIVSGWFNPILLVLCIAGLAAVGLILQYIDSKYDSILPGWLIHGCANLAINTIGTIIILGKY